MKNKMEKEIKTKRCVVKTMFFGDWKITRYYIENVKWSYRLDKSLLLDDLDWVSHLNNKIDFDLMNFMKAYIYFLKLIIAKNKKE